MIQMYISTTNGVRVCVYGITRGNVDRLTAGMPLVLRALQPADVSLVVFGEDKPSILRQLQANGVEVWDAHMAAAQADPL